MEKFRCCPICAGVPEQEIFQCRAGHIICHSCISKVNGNRCPQCRVPFETPLIRNRALEEILDSHYFECQFNDKGCNHLFKREEFTDHTNSCVYNPDTVPLCQQMGFVDCGFRLGFKTKAEVITHFTIVHNIWICRHPILSITIGGECFLTALNQEQKRDALMPKVGFCAICSSDVTDNTSPLFFVHGKWNPEIGCVSFECVKIWESDSHPTTKYFANFTFNKSSQNQERANNRGINENLPFPFEAKMPVCGIKDAHRIFEASPINVPASFLEKNGFGSNSLDNLQITITE